MKNFFKKEFDYYLSIIAACSLLILFAISGYRYLVSQSKKRIGFEAPEIKSVVTFFDTKYNQILPLNGQLIGDRVIVFEWTTALDVKTNFVVKNTETGCVVYTKSIHSETKQHRLNKYLGKGKYSWSLEGFNGEKIFVMK